MLTADALILLTSHPARYKGSASHLVRKALKWRWNWKWRSNNKNQGRSIISGAYLHGRCFEKKEERGKQKKRARGHPPPARVCPVLSAQQQQSLESYPIRISKLISLEWEIFYLFLVDLPGCFPKLWSAPGVMHFVVVVSRSLIRQLEPSVKNTLCIEFFPKIKPDYCK